MEPDGKAKPFRTSGGRAESKESCSRRGEASKVMVGIVGKAEPFRTSDGRAEGKKHLAAAKSDHKKKQQGQGE